MREWVVVYASGGFGLIEIGVPVEL